jgi:hypothetical protein
LARIDLTVDDEIEKKFRDAVCKAYGFKKRNMKAATEEAIELWLKTKNRRLK